MSRYWFESNWKTVNIVVRDQIAHFDKLPSHSLESLSLSFYRVGGTYPVEFGSPLVNMSTDRLVTVCNR